MYNKIIYSNLISAWHT